MATVTQTKFFDFEALRESVQDAPSDIVQLEPGQMTGTLTHLAVGTIGISHGEFSRGLRSLGVQSDRRWVFGTVLSAPVLMQHFEVAPGDSLIHPPGHELYEHYPGANAYVAAFIEPDELVAYLEQQPGAAEAVAAGQPSSVVLATDPATAAASIGQWSMLLDLLVKHGPLLSAELTDFYKCNILELVTAPIRDGANYRGAQLQSPVALVRKVDRFLADAGARPIHISELCTTFDVTRRTLHRAFEDVLGVPPITFLRRKRLGDVHTALLTARPGATISGISIEHGFADISRFAKEYRLLFGELPHDTLRRRNDIVRRDYAKAAPKDGL